MPAPSYMLSLLVRQYLFLLDAFHGRHPCSWLIWEPGAWRAARSTLEANTAITHQPQSRAAHWPVGSDALCFELKGAPGAGLSVGRASDSDIFINDLTLSREHLTLTFDDGAWALNVLPASNALTAIDDAPAASGPGYPLRSGAQVLAGEVQLTYYDVGGFLARLKSEAAQLTKR